MNAQNIEINEVDAKAGRKKKGMRYVLGISLGLIGALVVLIYLLFAA